MYNTCTKTHIQFTGIKSGSLSVTINRSHESLHTFYNKDTAVVPCFEELLQAGKQQLSPSAFWRKRSYASDK